MSAIYLSANTHSSLVSGLWWVHVAREGMAYSRWYCCWITLGVYITLAVLLYEQYNTKLFNKYLCDHSSRFPSAGNKLLWNQDILWIVQKQQHMDWRCVFCSIFGTWFRCCCWAEPGSALFCSQFPGSPRSAHAAATQYNALIGLHHVNGAEETTNDKAAIGRRTSEERALQPSRIQRSSASPGDTSS